MLSSNHALARRHHLLEGHVFNQLATAFKEEGKTRRHHLLEGHVFNQLATAFKEEGKTRRHHLLEGHVFNQLATAFKEEGKKCGQVNQSYFQASCFHLQFYTTCNNRIEAITM